MDNSKRQAIEGGRVSLGIELGSTRIKAVLIGEDHVPIASGSYAWENRYENSVWTYHLEDVWAGIQAAYQKLAQEVQASYGTAITKLSAIGFSAMMHGYLVFDKEGNQLVPFRTWRNTMTEQAAGLLTELFSFNIPQRWSIAHLYQALLNGEEHIHDIAFLTTLAGYVHWRLTGQKVLGVGEASGVFPIDSSTNNYNMRMIHKFYKLIADYNLPWTLQDILPAVLTAGEEAGVLTEEGARLLDPCGRLKAGIPLCPPEGDAGTGMVATNSVAARTGNVSAGTSVFAMVVLEKELSKVYTEIDMVTTPTGKPVAMVHCNNCSSDLDAWAGLFGELTETLGAKVDKPALYDALYFKALEGDADCGGLVTCNYLSGEPITGMEEGRPLFARMPGSRLTLANFMRTILFSTMATLKIGMDILLQKEHVCVEQLLGHGGLFKTKGVGQRLMAAALNTPVSVMETAGEGGAWGIAVLADYMKNKEQNEPLEHYLSEKVFAGRMGECVSPNPEDVRGFEGYMQRYLQGLAVERAAVEALK
ncbi:xylulokinase [Acetanaerobacterium elongatum]|uniref:Sugar (Pentulose or hexulose) kinase n=1 Tax=Acetanaerobacterium elongatum TaxID=258515 RepID=A0A1H0DAF8_9FIRM|nr:Sugar (pentulose or hexulose) kinase [Acetanaerobacterium elongatum]